MQREQLIRAREGHLRNVTRYEQDIAVCHAAIERLREMVADIDDDIRLLDAVATVGVLRSDVDVLLWQIVAAASDAGVSQTDLHQETGIARSTLRRRLDSMAHDEIRAEVRATVQELGARRSEDSTLQDAAASTEGADTPPPDDPILVATADMVPGSFDPDMYDPAEVGADGTLAGLLAPQKGADTPLARCTASYTDGTRRCRLLTGDHEAQHDYLTLPQPLLGGHGQQVAPVTISTDHQFDHPGPYLWDCSCGSGGVAPSRTLAIREMDDHAANGHPGDLRCTRCGEPGATVDDEAGPLHTACQAEALSDDP